MNKPRILVVDDEPFIAELLAELLMDEIDCEVVTAFNGLQALSLAERTRPALIMTDLMMPHMDGQTFVYTLRNTPSLQATPIVIMSAARQRPAWVQDGDFIFVAKPFEPDEVISTVTTLLDSAPPLSASR